MANGTCVEVCQLLDEVRELNRAFQQSSQEIKQREKTELDDALFTYQKPHRISPVFTTAGSANDISEDIKKMQMELKTSYELFIKTRDALEGINFEALKGRIKDLHLYPTEAEIDEILKSRPIEENLDELTEVMRTRFKDHPGEFGNIPELSNFFQACSKLHQGLNEFNAQTGRFNDLENRVARATRSYEDKSETIKNSLNIKKAIYRKGPSRENSNLKN